MIHRASMKASLNYCIRPGFPLFAGWPASIVHRADAVAHNGRTVLALFIQLSLLMFSRLRVAALEWDCISEGALTVVFFQRSGSQAGLALHGLPDLVC
jgi:hypothetical protein